MGVGVGNRVGKMKVKVVFTCEVVGFTSAGVGAGVN